MTYNQSVSLRWLIFAILLFIAILTFYPILFMGFAVFKPTIEYFKSPLAFPKTAYLDNLKAMYYAFNIIRLFGNTLFCVLMAGIINLTLTVPAAFVFAKRKFPLRSQLYIAVIGVSTIPTITFILPNYLLMSKLNLLNTPLSVILIWVATSIPWTVFLLSSLMRAIPSETIEAVTIDGGGYFSLLLRVVVPLSTPAIATVTIFNVTSWWNDLLTPLLFLQSDSVKTMTAGLATLMSRFSSDVPLQITGLFLTSLPPMLIYIFLQKFIQQGLVVGAVK
jgi:raffinose/stachyose/melibiose transport system permease protein